MKKKPSNHKSAAAAKKPAYVLEEFLPHTTNAVLVRRVLDGEIFLGTILRASDAATSETAKLAALNARSGLSKALLNLLNHENLVSLHATIVHWPFSAAGQSFGLVPQEKSNIVLWDWCDGGTLAEFMLRPGKGVMPTTHLKARDMFMPEGFVWTVLLGMLRALQWLHEGRRDEIVVRAQPLEMDGGKRDGGRCEKVRRVSEPERDWWPVLHRDIRAENIFLCQPRGLESYGGVKLGGFSKAYVSASVANGRGPVVAPNPLAMDEEGRDGDMAGLREARKRILTEGGLKAEERPYHTGTEIYYLGRILFKMMTNLELPPGDECPSCGCSHLRFDPPRKKKGSLGNLPDLTSTDGPPCPHECEDKDVNIFSVLLDVGAGYSPGLRSRVMEMLLGFQREVKGAAGNLLAVAWPEYLAWCKTEEGALHKDLWDDVWAREVSCGWRKVESLRAEAGEEGWMRAGMAAAMKGQKRKGEEEYYEDSDLDDWDGSTVRMTERGLEIIALESSSEEGEKEGGN
ncbi:hypothetical protein QBC37DRAFT_277584 [Rhypophila decipiens]|uniref:non-specific serine/threonine protein kinase n=1 Tax=Rhypophila decipiens TaxID=261697 RepID=A0AAN6YEY5_9PEZI|nr:hypothetical protein QBC37DRAFT_277584 [Rhypophila decipiens]